MVIRFTTFVFLLFSVLIANGQTNFRTTATGGGNWNSNTIWQIETPNGSNNWVAAGVGVFPTSASNNITVRTPDIVTITADITLDQVTVQNGGGLEIAPSITAIINNGATATDFTFQAGTFLTVYGRLTLNSAAVIAGLDGTADVSFEDGSFYRHLYQTTEGLIPVASWNANSTLEIFGYTASASSITFNGAFSAQNWEQSFGNVIIDCPLNTGRFINFDGHLNDIQGDLTFTRSTAGNSGRVQFTSATDAAVNIVGNFNISGNARVYLNEAADLTVDVGGNFNITTANTNTSRFVTGGSTTINITGDFNMNAAATTINLSQGSGPGIMNLNGDFNLLNGTLGEGGSGIGELNFNGSDQIIGQNFNKTAGTLSGEVNYYISPTTTLNMGTSTATGSGTFTSDGNLRVGFIGGGAINTGGNGNIRVTGTRTFTAGITIEYNGVGAQTVGNAFPANVNLIINNSNGVTQTNGFPITIAAGMSMDITAGSRFAIVNTNANSLTLNGTITGTGTITGATNANLIIGGGGSLGALLFTTGAQQINNFTINRPGGDAELGTNLLVSGALTQTAGDIILNGTTLTINAAFAQTSGNLVLQNDPTLVIGGAGTLPANVTFAGDLRLNTLTKNRAAAFTTNSNLFIVNQLNLQTGAFNNQGAVAMLTGSTLTRTAGSLQNPLANFGASEPFNIVYNNAALMATFRSCV